MHFFIFILCAFIFMSCQSIQRVTVPPYSYPGLDPDSSYIKVHMKNGGLYILSKWKINTNERLVLGSGDYFNLTRTSSSIVQGVSISFDSVALFESNRIVGESGSVPMAILTVGSVAFSAICLANPKACFGSCPTFYIDEDKQQILAAEGFSESIAPSLEATDVDALYRASPSSRTFTIVMKNEAFETHVVRHVDLLLAKRDHGKRVFHADDGTYYQVGSLDTPTKATGAEGDILPLVRSLDQKERFSLSDSINLSSKEVLEFEFVQPIAKNVGLIVTLRQSLLSTFLFYQGLAYLGTHAGEWIAAIERGDSLLKTRSAELFRRVGTATIMTQKEDGEWIPVGSIDEEGPIASDTRILVLPNAQSSTRKVRLLCTRGALRVDWIALGTIDHRVETMRMHPRRVIHDHRVDDRALCLLMNPDSVLITNRGDEYGMEYELPVDYPNYELFLESRGYYLEWLRESWFAEENVPLALAMIQNPSFAYTYLAPWYKQYEAEMESIFWSSRYAKP